MTTVIVDYNSGNLRSAEKSFERAAREADVGEIIVSKRPEIIRKADRVILPGVGAFRQCQGNLMARRGVFQALEERVKAGVPFLGICVGMQMLATWGLENGRTRGFGWINGDVVKLQTKEYKIPHMGWNELHLNAKHDVFKGLQKGSQVYFVHSYKLKTRNPEHTLATVDYGEKVNAIVGRDNIIGMQFHPEKSQAVGLRLIRNFLRWKP